MLGCPQFNDAYFYVDKLADIFTRDNIQGITMMVMAVPCCSKMKWIDEPSHGRGLVYNARQKDVPVSISYQFL